MLKIYCVSLLVENLRIYDTSATYRRTGSLSGISFDNQHDIKEVGRIARCRFAQSFYPAYFGGSYHQ